MNKKKIIFISLFLQLLFLLVFSGVFVIYRIYINPTSKPTITNSQALPEFTVEDLKNYDGTDPSKPIYIGLDGYIYDVSSGRNYYASGAGYHFLAGKDSSNELRIFGGNLLKNKYPVVGKLISSK